MIHVANLGKDIVFPSNNPPQIFLICGPCRSGTTAFANNFTVAGMESHMQPIKSVLREQAAGESSIPQEIVFHNDHVVLVKETFGAQEEVELYNPVYILIEAGYPPSKINVVGLVREPVAAFDSWMRLWGSVDGDIYERAYKLMQDIERDCAMYDVKYLQYVPEIIARNDPKNVISAVEKYFGYSNAAGNLTGWVGQPKFGDQDDRLSHLHFYDSPPEEFISGVREWGGYVYRDTASRTDHVVPNSAIAIYKMHKAECEKKLGLYV
jgi:hypothetical protein